MDKSAVNRSVINNSVGVLFESESTNRHLFLLRNDRKIQTWGLPGGKLERGETLKAGLERECLEEIEFWPHDCKLYPLEQYTSDDGRFVYHTFYSVIDSEFIPKLNSEHVGYCWIDCNTLPKPLHRGLFSTLNYQIIQQKIAIIRDSIK